MSEKSLGQVIKESILNDSRIAWNGEPERINSAYDAAANAVKAAIAKWPRCLNCGGKGALAILRRVDTEGDTLRGCKPDEMDCPACGGLGRVEPDTPMGTGITKAMESIRSAKGGRDEKSRYSNKFAALYGSCHPRTKFRMLAMDRK